MIKKTRTLFYCMVTDTLSDMLTRIRNASLMKKPTVIVPLTRLNQKVTQILEKEGFIDSFQISEIQSFNFLVLKLKYRSKQTYSGKKKDKHY